MADNTAEMQAKIEKLEERLRYVEDELSWMITAEQRFTLKQRVRFSARADAMGLSKRTKKGVQAGTIVKMQGFVVYVLLDGYKRASSYHHSFFQEVTRK